MLFRECIVPNPKTLLKGGAKMKYDDFMKEIGADVEMHTTRLIAKMVSDIIKRRKSLGWTQEEVAKKAGITQAQVARLENSSQIPRVDTLLKVAVSLGMNVSLTNIDEEASASSSYGIAIV